MRFVFFFSFLLLCVDYLSCFSVVRRGLEGEDGGWVRMGVRSRERLVKGKGEIGGDREDEIHPMGVYLDWVWNEMVDG